MILGFSRFFPDGKPSYFREKIWASLAYIYKAKIAAGTFEWNSDKSADSFLRAEYSKSGYRPKLHTLREGTRWRKGMSIQMAYGVRTKSYEQFNKGYEELATCTAVQEVIIKYPGPANHITGICIFVDGRKLSREESIELALNDGFESIEQFFEWFNKDFTGQIVHWSDKRY